MKARFVVIAVDVAGVPIHWLGSLSIGYIGVLHDGLFSRPAPCLWIVRSAQDHRGASILSWRPERVPCGSKIRVVVFPAHAGMNRDPTRAARGQRGVPCACRDELLTRITFVNNECNL